MFVNNIQRFNELDRQKNISARRIRARSRSIFVNNLFWFVDWVINKFILRTVVKRFDQNIKKIIRYLRKSLFIISKNEQFSTNIIFIVVISNITKFVDVKLSIESFFTTLSKSELSKSIDIVIGVAKKLVNVENFTVNFLITPTKFELSKSILFVNFINIFIVSKSDVNFSVSILKRFRQRDIIVESIINNLNSKLLLQRNLSLLFRQKSISRRPKNVF